MANVEAERRPNEGYHFRRISRTLESGLEDTGTTGLPGALTPEWPDFPPVGVENSLVSQMQEIQGLRAKGEIGKKTHDILQAQVRAIDYLYGSREIGIEVVKPENPLVDILTLISAPSRFSLTTQGAPKPKRFLGSVNKALKPEQYTYLENSAGRDEFRTVASFSRNLSTVVRGLYVLGEAAKHHPVFIRSALKEYAEKVKCGNVPVVTNTSMGLLEILNNTNLLYDSRFHTLSEQLRDVAFENVGGYTELKQRYPYMVLGQRAFWYNGEVHANGKRRNLKYVRTEEARRVDIKETQTYEFPLTTNWPQVSRKRQEMQRQIRGLTMAASVRRTALDFEEDKTIEAVKQDRIRKADLKAGVRNLQKAELDKLTRGWRKFLIEQIDEGAEVTLQETEYLRESTGQISEYFLQDETLSQKTKTNIRQAKDGEAKHYELDIQKLAHDPLFSWIFAIRNPYVAESLKASLENSPENAESFFLLLKLMTYKLAEGSFGKRELDFLFDPNYRQKVDSESLLKLFDSIRGLADKFIPDVREVVAATLAKRDSEIEDLVSEEYLQHTRKRLEDLTYRRILRILKFPKSRQFTQEDKAEVRKISKLTAISNGIIAGIIASVIGYSSIKEGIAERKAIEEQKQLQESARQAELEELKRQETQKRLERLKALEAQARQNLTERAKTPDASNNPEPPISLVNTPENIDDRIPDAIDRESLERVGLAIFGKMYHIPETMQGFDGEYIGYFPWDINMQLYENYTDFNLFDWYQYDEKENLSNYEVVDSIDVVSYDFAENQLAYAINNVNSVIYPPIGWKIVRVFQEGGKQPMVGTFGEIYYGYDGPDNFPDRALLVLEPLKIEAVAPRINRVSGMEIHDYWPYTWYPTAEEVNRALGDPILQKIHVDFIGEMKATEDAHYDRQISAEEMFQTMSEIGIKYASLYAQYTDLNRHYALSFDVDETKGNYASLKSVSQRPDEGYFCSVASFAFRDFMNSVGFVVANQPGMSLVNYKGYMWGRQGHQNSVVFLPNGEILEVDMTPPVTSDTAIEDLKALAGRYISPEDIEKAIEDIQIQEANKSEEVAEGAPVPETPALPDDMEKLRFIRNRSDYISQTEQEEILKDLKNETHQIVAERITEKPDLTNPQVLPDNQQRIEEISLAKQIENNSQRLIERGVSFEDIALDRVTPQEIEETVSLLDQIIEDSNLLTASLSDSRNPNQDTIKTLEENSQQAQRLKDTYEAIAGDILEQLRQDRAYVQSIEAELTLFQRYVKPQPKDNGNDIEKLRIEQEMEFRREVENQELYFIYGMRDVAKVRLDYVSKQIGNENHELYLHNGVDMETEDAQEISAERFYVDLELSFSPIVSRTIKLERLINNTPWLVDRLSDEDKQKVATFSKVVSDLRDTLNPTSNFTPLQQLARLKSEHSDLQEITDIIDDAWEDRIQDEQEQEQELKRFHAYSERLGEQPQAQPKTDEVANEEVNDKPDSLAKLAELYGLGLAPIAALSVGLRLRRKIKNQKDLQERIRDSFSASKRLTGQEKDIVVAAAGNLALMSYDKHFPQRLAGILNLLAQYDGDKHANSIDWLGNEGLEVSEEKSAKNAYAHLVFSANGGSPNQQVLAEIRRTFPYHIGEDVARLAKTHNGNSRTREISEVPHDFVISYALARILSTHHIASLMRDVFARLDINTASSDVSIPYKIEDISKLLREKYASSDIPEHVKPLFNAVYQLLQGTQIEIS